MPIEFLPGLAAFALVSSLTPGPNNLMLMASGANHGLRRTLPHMFGVALGFTFMVLMVGIGLVGLFNSYPMSYTVLKVVSVTYLLYLAYRIATAAAPGEKTGELEEKGRPFTFLQATAFQWVNPKAWTMALTAVSIYSPSREFAAVALVAATFGTINLPCITCWTLMGRQLRGILSSGRRLQVFNITMALLLVGSLYPVLMN